MDITYEVIGKHSYEQEDKTLIENGVKVSDLGHLTELFRYIYIPKNYERMIKRVSVIGVRNFDLWFKGGELALTTPQNFPKVEQQKELIDRMISSQSACLVFHPGKHKDQNIKVFQETLSYAQSREFPLLILNSDIPYSEIIEIVFKLDMNQQNKNENIFSKINQELFQYLSNNTTLQKTLRNIGKLTKSTYVVTDINFMPLTIFNQTQANVLETIIKHDKFQEFVNNEDIIRLLFNGNKLNVKIALNENVYNIITAPLKQDNQLKSVLFVQKKPDYFINKVINQLLNALALSKEQKSYSDNKILAQANDELINNNNFHKANNLYEQVGFSLQSKNTLILLELEILKNNKDYVNYILQRIQQYLKSIYIESDFSTIFNHQLVIFSSSANRQYHLKLGKKIITIIQQYFQNVKFFIGVSSSDAEHFQMLYKEALHAIQVGRQQKQILTFFQEVGYSQVFMELDDDYYLKQYYLNTLHPILLLDSKKQNELLDTLEAFLDCNLNYTATAASLYVHPNTIRYRIEQMKELFGHSNIFDDPDKRFNINFALKIRKTLLN